MPIQLYDTAHGHKIELRPREQGKVSVYVCGPTVYGDPHLGHGRFALVFDILRRYLRWSGYEVTYVSNVTDIDDKIIKRASQESTSTHNIVVRYEKAWYDALDRLGVERPDSDPHATDYVGHMIELIQRLVKAGVAYTTTTGVYFQPEKMEGYGLLARQSLESLRAGARVEVDEDKRSPLDFVLWKKAKEGEPSWSSPWGQGRPGWHTECVVMALDLLGEGFDIHGGGMDLAFPHHENERAQALADGKVFAHHWVHNGFVELQGEKMSKSLGNIWSLTDLLAEHDGRAYRLLVLRAHYRSPVEITPATIADAEAALERLDAFARRTAGMDGEPDHQVMASFRAAMDDDLDTPKVVALLFAQVKRANAALDDGDDPGPAVGAVREITAAIGLPLRTDTRVLSGDVAELVRQRDEARTNKDFDAADRIRETLTKMGYVVEDSAAGTQVRRRD